MDSLLEVIFDLDHEARAVSQRLGLAFARASTVRDHPAFVEMFAQLIQSRLPSVVPSR